MLREEYQTSPPGKGSAPRTRVFLRAGDAGRMLVIRPECAYITASIRKRHQRPQCCGGLHQPALGEVGRQRRLAEGADPGPLSGSQTAPVAGGRRSGSCRDRVRTRRSRTERGMVVSASPQGSRRRSGSHARHSDLASATVPAARAAELFGPGDYPAPVAQLSLRRPDPAHVATRVVATDPDLSAPPQRDAASQQGPG